MAYIPVHPNLCCNHKTTNLPLLEPILLGDHSVIENEQLTAHLRQAATGVREIFSSLFWQGGSSECTQVFSQEQTPHLPRKPLPKRGDSCSSEDIQKQELAFLAVYMIIKGRPRRKESSENQDLLPCLEAILAMPYPPHCFSIPQGKPGRASPHLAMRSPRS